jgi:formate dehydrogenase alpha subunit
MTNSIECVEKAEVFLITGSNTTDNHPIIGYGVRRAVQRGAKLILADPRQIPLSGLAEVWLRQKPGTDVAWINGLMHVIIDEGLADMDFVEKRTEDFESVRDMVKKYDPKTVEGITGIPADDIVAAARMFAPGKPGSILYSMGITQHTNGTDNVKSLANLAMLCGNMGVEGGGVNPLRGQNNVQGACDMGCLPNVYPGYQPVTSADANKKFAEAWGTELNDQLGMGLTTMIPAAHEGKITSLYIMGENPLLSDPDLGHVREAFDHLDFLVVQDIFLTETARVADVVLPATSYAERLGTVTNTERRVQITGKVIDPLPGTKPDWQIICEIAQKMGHDWEYESASEIFDEFAALTPQYGGISYARMESGGSLCWPCPTKEHPGTPVLHKDRFARGLGKFHAIEHRDPAEMPDKDFPMVLSTGRMLEHFHTGTMTRRSKGLDALAPGPYVEMNLADAGRLKVADGDQVRVESRRGVIELPVKVADRVDEGVLFIPFHFWEAAANELTNTALCPTAKIPELKVCSARVAKA